MEKVVKFVKENYTFCIGMAIFFIFFIVMVTFWLMRKGTFSLEDQNEVILECPSVVKAGDTIECDVYLNMVDSKPVLAVNANYDFTSNITYTSFGVDETECTGESCFEPFEFTENGFSVINLDGVLGGGLLGKLRVKLSEDAIPGDEISIGLKEIEICYDEDEEEKMLSLSDYSSQLRLSGNDAKLSHISINNEQIELLDSIYEYGFIVNSDVDKVIISYEADGYVSGIETNFTVDGDGYTPIHYGTNEFVITVVSEDESTSTEYTVNVFRNCIFSTSVYTYFPDENIIYVGTNDADAVISNLEPLDDDLSYALGDDGAQLLIKYGDETLLTIDIVGITFDCEVLDNKLYIQHDLTYGELLDTINSEVFSIKLFDGDGTEITDEDYYIVSGDTITIYYGDAILDIFEFSNDYLSIVGPFVVDNDTRTIKRIPLGTTYEEFREYFNTMGSISFLSSDANVEYADADLVHTGDIVRIVFDGETYVYNLSVLGDITGNGMVKINDVGILYRYLKGKEELNDLAIAAGDIVNDGTIKINDVGILYRYLKGKETSLEAGDD